MTDFSWRKPQKEETQEVAAKVSGVRKKVSATAREYIFFLCLLSIIALEILRHFVTYGINEAFSWDVVFTAMIDSITALFAFYLFFPNGKNDKMAKDTYQNAVRKMESIITAIKSSGKIYDFRVYCKNLNGKEEEEIRQERIAALENLYVTKEEYETKYRLMNSKELRKAVKSGDISKAAKKQIILCRKPVKTKPYMPGYFLSVQSQSQSDGYLHGGSKYGTVKLATKPVFLAFAVIVRNLFSVRQLQDIDVMVAVVSIIFSIFQICASAFMGYLVGWDTASKNEAVIDCKCNFMEEFFEKYNKEEGAKIANQTT